MSLMEIRQATINDYDQIMTILKDGANQLAERGVDQWQGEYPSPDQIKEDIEKGFAYLAVSADGKTVGAISIVEAPDHSYGYLIQISMLSFTALPFILSMLVTVMQLSF